MNEDSLYYSDICEKNYDLFHNLEELYEVAHGVHDNHEDEEYDRGSESYEQMATRHYA